MPSNYEDEPTVASPSSQTKLNKANKVELKEKPQRYVLRVSNLHKDKLENMNVKK